MAVYTLLRPQLNLHTGSSRGSLRFGPSSAAVLLRAVRARTPVAQRGSGVRCNAAAAGAAVALRAEDKFVASVLENVAASAPAPPQLEQLRAACTAALSDMRMPTTRIEDYRFTDISPLLRHSSLQAAVTAAGVAADDVVAAAAVDTDGCRVVLVNGLLNNELSQLQQLPQGVFIGSVRDAPHAAAQHLGHELSATAGPFEKLNGACASDVVCITVPEGVEVLDPIHVIHLSSGSEAALAVSAPRLLITAAANSRVEVIEEYAAMPSQAQPASPASYLCCAVTEIDIAAGASVKHGYIEEEAGGAYHMKTTAVTQARDSAYELTEVRLGGGLSRHDLRIRQDGPATNTTMAHFLLCGANQLHDLHSRLTLDHPDGAANQLHKCIAVDASARGVFDGNVRVNKAAQRTDAGQLSRNLLLVPRATVNVKPNLQIIADDVKCTHGCAVSDLSAEEMFYFRARGIAEADARRALVYSFGAEVVQKLGHKRLVQRLQRSIDAALNTVATA